MDYSQRLIVAVAGIAVLATACGGKQPEEAPQPVTEVAPPPPVVTAPPPAPMPVSEPATDMDAWRSTMEERIYFALDRSELSSEARATMAMKVEVMRSSPAVTVRIDGHADERGSDEYNLALSKRRAAEAKRFMVQQGIDASRIDTEGYGEEQPLDPGTSETAWAMNRRAGFQVTGGSVSQR